MSESTNIKLSEINSEVSGFRETLENVRRSL